MRIGINSIEVNSGASEFEKGESLTRLAFFRFRRNKLALASTLFIVALVLGAVFAPWVAPRHFAEEDFFSTYLPPSGEFLLGTDFLGRDVFSRIIYGTRVSLTVAVVGALTSFIVGVCYGLFSGYLGGRMDEWMMRVVDILYAIPTLLFIILIMVYFRAGKPEDFSGIKEFLYQLDAGMGGMLFIFIGIGLTSWLRMARIARSETLSIKQREFIEADISQGFSKTRILFKGVLPNIVGTCIVAESIEIPTYILF